VLATLPSHSHRIKFDASGLPIADLSNLGSQFTVEEVWSVIRALPPDKALDPNSLMACFLQAAWSVIKHDLMCALDTF
jgi:hypothetical protein